MRADYVSIACRSISGLNIMRIKETRSLNLRAGVVISKNGVQLRLKGL